MSTQPTVIAQKWGSLDIMLKGIDGLLEAAAEIVCAEVRQRIKSASHSGRMYYKPGTKWTGAGRKAGAFASMKTGKTYGVFRKGKRLMYQASAPGEVPAVATGSLFKYVGRSTAYRTGPASWAVDIGDRAHSGRTKHSYPATLEKTRPLWIPSLQSPGVQQKIIEIWQRR